jgi:hypothetical protein
LAANRKVGAGKNEREHGTRYRTGVHGLLTVELVRKYAAQGMSLKEIGNLIGCTGANIGDAIRKDNDLKAAWEQGHAGLVEKLTSSLMRQVEKDSIIAVIFALKSRCGWVEFEKVMNRQDEANRPAVTVYIPHNSRDSVVPEQQGGEND